MPSGQPLPEIMELLSPWSQLWATPQVRHSPAPELTGTVTPGSVISLDKGWCVAFWQEGQMCYSFCVLRHKSCEDVDQWRASTSNSVKFLHALPCAGQQMPMFFSGRFSLDCPKRLLCVPQLKVYLRFCHYSKLPYFFFFEWLNRESMW